jgi:copper(I)-binding protein
MRCSLLVSLCAVAIVVSLGACASNQPLAITDVWARPGIVGGNSAVYLTINNPGRADALLSAQSDVAAQVELHMTKMEQSGAMVMHHQDSIAIPAGGQVKFESGGLHVMLTNLRHDLKAGDAFSVTLKFQSAGERTVQVQVREP